MLPGWGGGGGGYREEDPFAADNARKAEVDQIFAGDNTGIDFDAYEDIPVEARTPPPLIEMLHQLCLLPVCRRVCCAASLQSMPGSPLVSVAAHVLGQFLVTPMPCTRLVMQQVMQQMAWGRLSGRPEGGIDWHCVCRPLGRGAVCARLQATGEGVPEPITAFTDVELGSALMANVQRCKYTKPTPVQRYSIPIGMANRDLMACAQTGSGKTGGRPSHPGVFYSCDHRVTLRSFVLVRVRCSITAREMVPAAKQPAGQGHHRGCLRRVAAAFCFPIIANILRLNLPPTGRSRKAFPSALVLAPTRELSSQIYEEARKFAYQTGLRAVVVYGGAPVVDQVTQPSFCICPRAPCSWHCSGRNHAGRRVTA